MGLRYDDVTDSVTDLLNQVQANYFPELNNAKIKALFDLKRRRSGGMIVLARILKTNDLLRHLTRDENGGFDGYDYIITIDKVCWDNSTEEDRRRLLRHELRHTFFDIESEKNPYKLVSHSISDFHEEVELNKDDPRWRDRVGALVESIYEQQKDSAPEGGKGKKRGLSF